MSGSKSRGNAIDYCRRSSAVSTALAIVLWLCKLRGHEPPRAHVTGPISRWSSEFLLLGPRKRCPGCRAASPFARTIQCAAFPFARTIQVRRSVFRNVGLHHCCDHRSRDRLLCLLGVAREPQELRSVTVTSCSGQWEARRCLPFRVEEPIFHIRGRARS